MDSSNPEFLQPVPEFTVGASAAILVDLGVDIGRAEDLERGAVEIRLAIFADTALDDTSTNEYLDGPGCCRSHGSLSRPDEGSLAIAWRPGTRRPGGHGWGRWFRNGDPGCSRREAATGIDHARLES